MWFVFCCLYYDGWIINTQLSISDHCIPPNLRCDLSPNCPHGEDEDDCLQKYREKKLIPAEATFQCPHIYHPNVTTLAVRCDGVTECDNVEDEENCNKDAFSFEYMLIIIGSLALFSFIPIKYLAMYFVRDISPINIEMDSIIIQNGACNNVKNEIVPDFLKMIIEAK